MSNNGYAIYIDKPVLERFTKPGNNFLIANSLFIKQKHLDKYCIIFITFFI